MTKSITVAPNIAEPYIEVSARTRVRFHFTERWAELGLPDAWIEVTLSDSRDAIEIYGDRSLALRADACNKLTVASMDMYGGETELLELRKRVTELVHQVNVAQDPMRRTRK